MESVQQRLNVRHSPVVLPIGEEGNFKGLVDLVRMKAIVYYNDLGTDIREEEIPADLMELAQKYRAQLIDQVAEYDDEVMEKYLAGEELSEADIIKAMRAGTLAVKFFPMFCGDALSNKGAQLLLDYVAQLLPSPLEKPPVVGHDPRDEEKEIVRTSSEEEPFTALAFKIATDPHVGRITFSRVYSGRINTGSYILNSTRDDKERVSRIVLLHSNHREEVESLGAGEIGALVGMKITKTGDTLCDPENPIRLEGITFAKPVISKALEPKTKGDQDKMGEALAKLGDEDPTLLIESDPDTGQTIISGMGEVQLEVIVDRMKREFKVEVNTGAPQVAYKETIQNPVEQETKYIKQSGGKGQYGHVKILFEPNPEADFLFENKVVGGSIPKEYIPSVEKGLKKSLGAGVIAGYPIINLKATLNFGSYHEVDSSDTAFQVAASMCLKEAMRNSSSQAVLLEPIMKVEVVFPEEYQGSVQGSILSRRGLILGTESRGNATVLDAEVPLSEMFGYTTELRSITSGRGTSTMEFKKYAPVPNNVTEQIAKGRAGKLKSDE